MWKLLFEFYGCVFWIGFCDKKLDIIRRYCFKRLREDRQHLELLESCESMVRLHRRRSGRSTVAAREGESPLSSA
jgi:hypothetical protein